MATWRELFESGVSRLHKAGMTDGESTMRLLFEDAFGIRPVQYLMNPDTEMDSGDLRRYEQYMQRLQRWEPLAYILGSVEFMGLPFTVNPSVLIPRQDTECLVEWLLEDIGDAGEETVADICTGSGCIIESLLYYRPELHGVGTDISLAALEAADHNAKQLMVDNRLELLQGDLLQALPRERRFDRIVSNPPYISQRDMEELLPNVRQEPSLALYGGPDGLDFYRRIGCQAFEYLKDGGMLYFEIGYDQGHTVPAILKELGYVHIQVRRDLAGKDRMVRCQI